MDINSNNSSDKEIDSFDLCVGIKISNFKDRICQ